MRQLGIDFASEWQLTREFLELHTKEQLQELCKEWRIADTTRNRETAKRTDIIDAMLAISSQPTLPKRLTKLKPTSITR